MSKLSRKLRTLAANVLHKKRLTSQGSTKPPAVDLFAPAFWGRPNATGAILQRLHVVGPYPTEEFFRRFREKFDPKEVLLVADEGCSPEEVERIRSLFQGREFQVRYATCLGSGLVHAKIYMAEWAIPETPATVKQLVWGSANASRNGFEVNAEAVSSVSIEYAQELSLLPYFRQLWQKSSGTTNTVDTLLPGGVRIVLPSFAFSSNPEPESFDAWIEAGRLCHKYQPDPTFAKLSVTLKKPLPHDTIQSLFTRAELRPDTDSSVFRSPSLGEMTRTESKKVPRWRAKFFLETWLGFWTSNACYKAFRDSFYAQNEQQRKEVLTQIKLSNRAEHLAWSDDFIERLGRVVAGLKDEGLKPRDYFFTTKNDLDVSHYKDHTRKQLENHRSRANNAVFEERFTTGYVFPPLPRFRGTEAVEGGSFQDFVDSLCESILTGIAKRRCENLIVQVVREQLRERRIDAARMTGSDLKETIRRYWNRIGPKVRHFYA